MAGINELLNLAQYISQGEQSQAYGIPEMIQGGLAGYQGEIERRKREHAERLKLAEQLIGLKQKMLEMQETAKSQRILDTRTGAMSVLGQTAGVKQEQLPKTEMGKVTNLVDTEFEEHIGPPEDMVTKSQIQAGIPSGKTKFEITPTGRKVTIEEREEKEPETIKITEPWEVDAFQERGYKQIGIGSTVRKKVYDVIIPSDTDLKDYTIVDPGTGKVIGTVKSAARPISKPREYKQEEAYKKYAVLERQTLDEFQEFALKDPAVSKISIEELVEMYVKTLKNKASLWGIPIDDDYLRSIYQPDSAIANLLRKSGLYKVSPTLKKTELKTKTQPLTTDIDDVLGLGLE